MATVTAIVSLESAGGLVTGGDTGSKSWFANVIARENITHANIRGTGATLLGGDRLFVWLVHGA